MRYRAFQLLAGLGYVVAVPAIVAAPSYALAQGSQAPAPDTVSVKRFDIPSQPLPKALEAFSLLSGLRVEADSAAIAGLDSRAVAGDYTAAEALRRLLAATGLTPHFNSARVAVLRKEPARDFATLNAVRVVASNQRTRYAASGTVSATRIETALRDVPQAATIVTHELVRDQAMQSIADVVRYVPGVVMGQGEGNRDQPTIRGNTTTADFFVDGVRDDVQYLRDLYNLDRVEALKGSNAMIFGRGGGGGVINRVMKEPQWTPLRELVLEGGSHDHKRASADIDAPLSGRIASRLNGVYEKSGLFRDGVTLERFGINPTLTFPVGGKGTRFTVGYEHFNDLRTADRGVPSFHGRPLETNVATFFGDPDVSYSHARVNTANATVSHTASSGLNLRNRTVFADYVKKYQNVFPGAVNAAGDQVSLSAYNNATDRRNLFNQADVTYALTSGSLRHTLLAGSEVGHQATDNFRNTGYFNNTTTSLSAAVASPTVSAPVTFRQSAADADNHVVNTVASLYAQDQFAVGEHVMLIAGVRYETFAIRYHNNRTDSTLRREDHMVSPRAGLVIKPVPPLSFYGSYSVSYLPSSGDQFSSLTDVTMGLDPERFHNYELGVKWDVADGLSLTTAAYRLDRTNTRAPDPFDPTRTVQTGSQRTNGFEVGVNGSVTKRWEIAGGYASQDAFITSTTTAAATGARVPVVPKSTLSLWNKCRLSPRWGLALGVVHRTDMYAAIDNTVTLPGFTEADGALYATLTGNLRAQLNVENLFDTRYFVSSNGNNNISPGSPRAFRLSLSTEF